MNSYKFEHLGITETIIARNRRTAIRRWRGMVRGELDINGKTILAKKRKPPGQPMRKGKKS